MALVRGSATLGNQLYALHRSSRDPIFRVAMKFRMGEGAPSALAREAAEELVRVRTRVRARGMGRTPVQPFINKVNDALQRLRRAIRSSSTKTKTRNPAKKAPKRARAGRPLREGQRVYHCARKCR